MYEIELNETLKAFFPYWHAVDKNTVARVASGGAE